MASYATREDKRLRHIKHKQDSIYQRKLFVEGKARHEGFIFFYVPQRNSFHLIRDNKKTYCGEKLYEPTRKYQNEIIIVKKLSDITDQMIKGRQIKERELCWMCENIFLGLYKGEKFKKQKHTDHINIFNIPSDDLFVDEYLAELLIYPVWRGFPRLTSYDQILTLPYNIQPAP